MADIRVMYWNIETFGRFKQSRGDYIALCNFIAAVVLNKNVDILLIQEVVSAAMLGRLAALHEALNNLPTPFNNWYADVVKGSICNQNPQIPFPTPPYATAASLAWDTHHEGYAVFWRQNIAKFTMQLNPPLLDPAGNTTPNTQSEQVRAMVQNNQGISIPFIPVPNNGITVPAPVGGNGPFILPAGTTVGVGGITRPGAVAPVVPPGVTGAAINLNAGDTIPAGTTIGGINQSGLQLPQIQNVNPHYTLVPILVPARFELTDPLVLPTAGSIVVPLHVLSLVMQGRLFVPTDTRLSRDVISFIRAVPNTWSDLLFVTSDNAVGGAARSVMVAQNIRRPAFCTIQVNAANRPLVPIQVYHAPSRLGAASRGMQRSACSQVLYQVYNRNTDAAGAVIGWQNNNFVIAGGDYNVRLDDANEPYTCYTTAFNIQTHQPTAAAVGAVPGVGRLNGGANCTILINNPQIAPGTQGDNPANQTCLQLTEGIGGLPINGNTGNNDFLTLAIDNIFYDGFNAAGGLAPTLLPNTNIGIINLLNELNAAPPNHNLLAILQQFSPIFWNLIAGGNIRRSMQNPVELWMNLAGGAFTPPAAANRPTQARKAAEFIKLAISDHFPVLFGATF